MEFIIYQNFLEYPEGYLAMEVRIFAEKPGPTFNYNKLLRDVADIEPLIYIQHCGSSLVRFENENIEFEPSKEVSKRVYADRNNGRDGRHDRAYWTSYSDHERSA